MFNCCLHGPFSTSSLKVSLEYFATTTKICTGGGSRRAHARTFKASHRHPPTHCGVNLHEGSSAVRPGIGPTLSVIQFQG
ncbi:hypothetical protein JTE90_011638 [Oedothorax gibbosus]|uniref:Uncharacterized protein n=1 Tax=Oedothorax gibbosus TaxID=931172 RepID=A0AAV6TFS1_9ARAC|nr:hypothetical protein JTE90_011638 [Oedothorax gibbosus]